MVRASESERVTMKPNSREAKALRYMMPNTIEKPAIVAGVGKQTWDVIIRKGWVEWVDSPETNEEGYRITDEGQRVAFQ